EDAPVGSRCFPCGDSDISVLMEPGLCGILRDLTGSNRDIVAEYRDIMGCFGIFWRPRSAEPRRGGWSRGLVRFRAASTHSAQMRQRARLRCYLSPRDRA